MAKTLKELYKEEKPVGVYSMGMCGVLFYIVTGEDETSHGKGIDFVCALSVPNDTDERITDYRRVRMFYDDFEEPCVKYMARVISLSDVLRVYG